MSIIQVSKGSVFFFSDGQLGIQQIAGTEDVFRRNIRNELVFTSQSKLDLLQHSTLDINEKSTLIMGRKQNSSPSVFYNHSSLTSTSTNITTLDELRDAGSFISVRGSNSHTLYLSNSSDLEGCVIKYVKANNNTTTIEVRSHNNSNTISGWFGYFSSDPYASIELVLLATTSGRIWIITSKVGNWSTSSL